MIFILISYDFHIIFHILGPGTQAQGPKWWLGLGPRAFGPNNTCKTYLKYMNIQCFADIN